MSSNRRRPPQLAEYQNAFIKRQFILNLLYLYLSGTSSELREAWKETKAVPTSPEFIENLIKAANQEIINLNASLEIRSDELKNELKKLKNSEDPSYYSTIDTILGGMPDSVSHYASNTSEYEPELEEDYDKRQESEWQEWGFIGTPNIYLLAALNKSIKGTQSLKSLGHSFSQEKLEFQALKNLCKSILLNADATVFNLETSSSGHMLSLETLQFLLKKLTELNAALELFQNANKIDDTPVRAAEKKDPSKSANNKTYNLALWQDNLKANELVVDTVYLLEDGSYVFKSVNGSVRMGKFGNKVDLSNLSNRLNDDELKKQVTRFISNLKPPTTRQGNDTVNSKPLLLTTTVGNNSQPKSFVKKDRTVAKFASGFSFLAAAACATVLAITAPLTWPVIVAFAIGAAFVGGVLGAGVGDLWESLRKKTTPQIRGVVNAHFRNDGRKHESQNNAGPSVDAKNVSEYVSPQFNPVGDDVRKLEEEEEKREDTDDEKERAQDLTKTSVPSTTAKQNFEIGKLSINEPIVDRPKSSTSALNSSISLSGPLHGISGKDCTVPPNTPKKSSSSLTSVTLGCEPDMALITPAAGGHGMFQPVANGSPNGSAGGILFVPAGIDHTTAKKTEKLPCMLL